MLEALRIHQVRGHRIAWEESGAEVGSQNHFVVAMCSHPFIDDLLRTGTTIVLHTSERTDPGYLRRVLGILGPMGMTRG